MKVAGIMAISDFPLAPEMGKRFAILCDYVILRFDQYTYNEHMWRQCQQAVHAIGKPLIQLNGTGIWNKWNWREQLLRELDVLKPDYVFFLDSDECFDIPDFLSDVSEFKKSQLDLMMFDYVMVTDNDRAVTRYPKARHCKAFKWQPGLTYNPYRGYAKPGHPDIDLTEYAASSKIRHYCFYTQYMETSKVLHK